MVGNSITCCSYVISGSCSFSALSRSLPSSATAAFERSVAISSGISDTPLSPSHAGDKGDIFTDNANQKPSGQRPVDMAVLPRPSFKEEGKAAVSAPSNQPPSRQQSTGPSRALHDFVSHLIVVSQDAGSMLNTYARSSYTEVNTKHSLAVPALWAYEAFKKEIEKDARMKGVGKQ